MKKMNKKAHPSQWLIVNQAGFTLIETLIYIGLLSLLLAGLLGITYQTIDNTGRINQKIVLEQEGMFIVRKMQWALTGATAVSMPNSSTLTVTKIVSAVPTTLIFSINAASVTLDPGTGVAYRLNSSNVTVSALAFTDIPATAQMPEGITANFNLSNQVFKNEPFGITEYLKQ